MDNSVQKKIEDRLVGLTAGGDFYGVGFSNQILAGVFQFYNQRHNNQSSFLADNSKWNKFYPFVPVSHKEKTQNTTEEMRIMETRPTRCLLRGQRFV